MNSVLRLKFKNNLKDNVSLMKGVFFKQLTGCATMTLLRFSRCSENRDGMNVEVELDMIVSAPTKLSSSRNSFFFSSIFSGIHSCTKIAPLTISSKVETPTNKSTN